MFAHSAPVPTPASSSQATTFEGYDTRTVMLTISALDCFAMLVFFILINVLKRRQYQYVEANDEEVTSLSDYTVEVWGRAIAFADYNPNPMSNGGDALVEALKRVYHAWCTLQDYYAGLMVGRYGTG